MALFTVQCKRATIMLKLENTGILDGVQDASQAEAHLDLYLDLWNIDVTWRTFKQWVASNKPVSDALFVRNLKQRTVEDIASCTEAVIARAIQNLTQLCRECAIMHLGIC